MRIRILFVVLTLFIGVVSFPQGPAAPQQSALRPRVLIVFKNGLSWIEHRGDAALSGGWGVISTAPEASLGTVSLTSDEAKIDEVRTVGASPNPVRSHTSLDALLQRNAGRMVTLRVGDRDVTGRLRPSVAQPISGDVENAIRNGYMVNTEVILLESGGKTTAIQRGLVTAATFEGEISTEKEAAGPSLRFHVAEKSGSVPIRLSYIRPGIGWFPDYSIALDGNGRAALTMRATLVDDGEDLRDTDVLFAVGYPNFAFGHVPSPLTGRHALTELFRILGGGATEAMNAMANMAVASQMSMPDTGRNSSFGATLAAGAQGESADDFFLYSRKGITLAKGERASFPLLEASVKYSDVYTLDIPRETENDPYNRRTTPPSGDRVWHSIRLENPTKVPWTTAPALVFAGGRPIAQETLHYTPALGQTTLRLTVANNVIADRNESEVSRQRETVRRFDNTWDAVTIEGTVDIRNFKEDEIMVAISREIEGEAIASPGLRVTRVAMQPRAVNPIERLQWEIPLKAGEKRTIKYQYKVYVRA